MPETTNLRSFSLTQKGHWSRFGPPKDPITKKKKKLFPPRRLQGLCSGVCDVVVDGGKSSKWRTTVKTSFLSPFTSSPSWEPDR